MFLFSAESLRCSKHAKPETKLPKLECQPLYQKNVSIKKHKKNCQKIQASPNLHFSFFWGGRGEIHTKNNKHYKQHVQPIPFFPPPSPRKPEKHYVTKGDPHFPKNLRMNAFAVLRRAYQTEALRSGDQAMARWRRNLETLKSIPPHYIKNYTMVWCIDVWKFCIETKKQHMFQTLCDVVGRSGEPKSWISAQREQINASRIPIPWRINRTNGIPWRINRTNGIFYPSLGPRD